MVALLQRERGHVRLLTENQTMGANSAHVLPELRLVLLLEPIHSDKPSLKLYRRRRRALCSRLHFTPTSALEESYPWGHDV